MMRLFYRLNQTIMPCDTTEDKPQKQMPGHQNKTRIILCYKPKSTQFLSPVLLLIGSDKLWGRLSYWWSCSLKEFLLEQLWTYITSHPLKKTWTVHKCLKTLNCMGNCGELCGIVQSFGQPNIQSPVFQPSYYFHSNNSFSFRLLILHTSVLVAFWEAFESFSFRLLLCLSILVVDLSVFC